jgi:hypothetical protein
MIAMGVNNGASPASSSAPADRGSRLGPSRHTRGSAFGFPGPEPCTEALRLRLSPSLRVSRPVFPRIAFNLREITGAKVRDQSGQGIEGHLDEADHLRTQTTSKTTTVLAPERSAKQISLWVTHPTRPSDIMYKD